MNEIAALVCAILTFIMALLHMALLCGAPLGEYVLGGTDRVIPKEKRRVDVIFLYIFIVVGFIYLTRTPYINLVIPSMLRYIICGMYTLFLAYAIVGNMLLTNSKKEKYLMTPLSIIGFVSSVLSMI